MTKVMSRDRVEARFGAMGHEARVVVLGGAPRADERARHLIEVVERKWSRFRSGSEISRVNEKSGQPVVVSAQTYGLVTRAIAAWRVTDGRFDPTDPPVGCARIELDERHRAVRLPAGAHLDVGAVARAFATDLVVEALTEQGATGALVSIGPDVRVAGEPPRAEGWLIDVDDPHRAGALGRLRLRAGAVSTCTGRERAGSGVGAVTVVAGEAWWAQALARAVMVAGPDAGVGLLARHGVTGLAVRADGEVLEAPGLDAFC